MDTMQKVVLIAHTFVAIMIIVLVLFQRGKGADAGAAFGSGASGTVFGARGSSNFFSRATAILATVFFASSLTLAYMSSQRANRGPSSLIEQAPAVEAGEQPAETTPDSGADPATDMPTLDDAVEPEPDAVELPALEEPGKPDDEENPQD
ncbi:MAG: preprotein translocase subunit SecG [Woeseia sp.]